MARRIESRNQQSPTCGAPRMRALEFPNIGALHISQRSILCLNRIQARQVGTGTPGGVCFCFSICSGFHKDCQANHPVAQCYPFFCFSGKGSPLNSSNKKRVPFFPISTWHLRPFRLAQMMMFQAFDRALSGPLCVHSSEHRRRGGELSKLHLWDELTVTTI